MGIFTRKNGGFMYFLLGMAGAVFITFLIFLGVKIRQKTTKNKKNQRKLIYKLPDRENTYIRARLNTVLQAKTKAIDELGFDCAETLRTETAAYSFGYARELLSKVKEAPLTLIERAQAEEIGKLFGLYLRKTAWNANDIHVLSDAFSALLKLSAKYAV